MNTELPKLDNYKVDIDQSFWDLVTGYEIPETHESWIYKEELKHEAEKAGYKSKKLDITIDILENGINIGVETPEARMVTDKGSNYEAVYEFGEEFMDSLQTWLKEQIVAGPFTKKELEERGFDKLKIIPVQIRPKPNGKLRIILDLSFPHLSKKEIKKGVPTSVNAGIPKRKYPAKMAGTKDILKRLTQTGRLSEFTKIDWKSAYKHFPVRRQDWELQIIEFGGRYFLELRAAFGTRSSPYYFDIGSDVVKELVCLNVKVKRNFAPKCLDDIIPLGRIKDGKVKEYAEEYVRICKAVGIKLAEESDGPGKCFGIQKEGEVLGVIYDLQKWRWRVPEAKSLRLENEIWNAITREEITKGGLETIIGKITHYGPLIPNGKFNRSWLLAHDGGEIRETSKQDILKLSKGAIHQMKWWLAALQTCHEGAPIPDIRNWARYEGLELHSDAAGGSQGAGMGGVAKECPSSERAAWTQEQWPKWLNNGELSESGAQMGKKLSTLEGLAAMGMLLGVAKEARGQTVYLMIDNAGFVFGFKAGHSACLYLSTITKALSDIGIALGAKLMVTKQARCSDLWSKAADALSKNDEERFKEEMKGRVEKKKRILPRTLRQWIQSPYPDPELGLKIVKELSHSMEVEIWEEPRMTLKEKKESNEVLKEIKKTPKKRKSQEESNRGTEGRRIAKRKRKEN